MEMGIVKIHDDDDVDEEQEKDNGGFSQSTKTNIQTCNETLMIMQCRRAVTFYLTQHLDDFWNCPSVGYVNDDIYEVVELN